MPDETKSYRLVLKPVPLNLHVWLPMLVTDGADAAGDFVLVHVRPDDEQFVELHTCEGWTCPGLFGDGQLFPLGKQAHDLEEQFDLMYVRPFEQFGHAVLWVDREAFDGDDRTRVHFWGHVMTGHAVLFGVFVQREVVATDAGIFR